MSTTDLHTTSRSWLRIRVNNQLVAVENPNCLSYRRPIWKLKESKTKQCLFPNLWHSSVENLPAKSGFRLFHTVLESTSFPLQVHMSIDIGIEGYYTTVPCPHRAASSLFVQLPLHPIQVGDIRVRCTLRTLTRDRG